MITEIRTTIAIGRKMAGMSMEALAQATGALVSKQAIKGKGVRLKAPVKVGKE